MQNIWKTGGKHLKQMEIWDATQGKLWKHMEWSPKDSCTPTGECTGPDWYSTAFCKEPMPTTAIRRVYGGFVNIR